MFPFNKYSFFTMILEIVYSLPIPISYWLTLFNQNVPTWNCCCYCCCGWWCCCFATKYSFRVTMITIITGMAIISITLFLTHQKAMRISSFENTILQYFFRTLGTCFRLWDSLQWGGYFQKVDHTVQYRQCLLLLYCNESHDLKPV